MQDGSLPHIPHCVKQMLRCHFGDDKIMSSQFPTAWPSKYLALNHCDFWLKAYFKAIVYRDLIISPPDLKESI
ncbi:uncharacterized protein TNCV_3410511 [Trichonephila clavipes]|nr:uncharacterized protein TNCV_3410511 [Trichonephila clavipes]